MQYQLLIICVLFLLNKNLIIELFIITMPMMIVWWDALKISKEKKIIHKFFEWKKNREEKEKRNLFISFNISVIRSEIRNDSILSDEFISTKTQQIQLEILVTSDVRFYTMAVSKSVFVLVFSFLFFSVDKI